MPAAPLLDKNGDAERKQDRLGEVDRRKQLDLPEVIDRHQGEDGEKDVEQDFLNRHAEQGDGANDRRDEHNQREKTVEFASLIHIPNVSIGELAAAADGAKGRRND